jgi:hypothetical protein
MHKDKEEPYDPASDPGKDGFVFSNEEIQETIRVRNRTERAAQAAAYFDVQDPCELVWIRSAEKR